MYVANNQSNTVSIIDGKKNSEVATVAVGRSPAAVAVNPSPNMMYVANSDGDTVSVIDGQTNTVVKTLDVGSSPADVAVNPILI